MAEDYDLVVIGGGTAGLTAAGVARLLDARVALVEKQRLGGDCTWAGCVPSKALLKAAKVAHTVRTAAHYGTRVEPPRIDMPRVRRYVREVSEHIYQHETPDVLKSKGIDVILAPARFVDAHTLEAGERRLTARRFLIATGARAFVPRIPGLRDVSFHTYETVFDNDRLPVHLLVIGAGPIGAEIAQAYARFGAQVTLIDERLLPKDEPEVAEVLGRVFAREGIRFVPSLVSSVRTEGPTCVVVADGHEIRGDMLLVAVGRTPTVEGMNLDEIGVQSSAKDGIRVDSHLRTTVSHIYAAGDCVGSYQFTHFAGWQAFHAVRNALLPLGRSGFSEAAPWATFTDPEVAHVGLAEAEARRRFGDDVRVTRRGLRDVDRAVCENDTDGFIKVVHRRNGTVLGATIVAQRAGEAITELVLALDHGLTPRQLATSIHVYPTYADGVQQALGTVASESLMTGLTGTLIKAALKVLR